MRSKVLITGFIIFLVGSGLWSVKNLLIGGYKQAPIYLSSQSEGKTLVFADRKGFEQFLDEIGFWETNKWSEVFSKPKQKIREYRIIYTDKYLFPVKGYAGEDKGKSYMYDLDNGVLVMKIQTVNPTADRLPPMMDKNTRILVVLLTLTMLLVACNPAEGTIQPTGTKPAATTPLLTVTRTVLTETPTFKPSHTATVEPSKTPGILLGAASEKPTIIEGLTLPESVPSSINKSDFEKVNPGMALMIPESEVEQKQVQFMDPKLKVGEQYRGGMIAEEVLSNIFHLEADKSGLTRSREGIIQIDPLTYMDYEGKYFVAATPVGFPVLFKDKDGRMMFGSVGSDMKIAFSFPAFQTPGELAKIWGYEGDAGEVVSLRLERTANQQGSYTGRMQILGGDKKGELVETKMKFMGNRTSEVKSIEMLNVEIPVPDVIVEKMKNSQLPKTWEIKEVGGGEVGSKEFKVFWYGKYHTTEFNLLLPKGELLGRVLAWRIGYNFDSSGKAVAKLHPIATRLERDPQKRVFYAGNNLTFVWDERKDEGVKLQNPKVYNKVFFNAGEGTVQRIIIPWEEAQLKRGSLYGDLMWQVAYAAALAPNIREWKPEWEKYLNSGMNDLDVLFLVEYQTLGS